MEIDPEGLAQHSLIQKKKRRANLFRADGPLFVVSLDGHVSSVGIKIGHFL